MQAPNTKQLTPRRIAAAVSALLAVAAVADAQASTISLGSYAGLFQGVSEMAANVDGHTAAVVRVDLSAPGISFTTTAPCAGCTANSGSGNEVVKQKTGDYMVSVGAQVAINANRYANNDNQPTATAFSGLGVSNGTLTSSDESGFAALLISSTNQASIVPGGSVSSLNGVQNAIAGTQGTILTNGINNAVSDNQSANRSGLGLSADGRYLYLMDVSGVNLGEESDLFSALGAWDAINLNGGSSAMLDVANGSGGVTMLNHTTEKYVGPNLAIFAAPLTPVPLPPAVVLFGSGLLVMFGLRRRRGTRITTAISALLSIGMLTEAQASTFTIGNYDPLFQGIDETTATIQGGSGVSQAYVVRINLNAPGVGFNTTPHSGSMETTSQTTSQYLASSGSQVAINAAFFDPCGCSTTTSDAKNLEGLAISNGVLVSQDQAGNASLLLTQDNHASLAAGGTANISNIWTAVSGGGFVLQNGVDVVTGSLPGDPLNPNPRSVVGLSKDDMYMYLVAIDGRQAGYSNGVTQAEEADLMHVLGAYNAINLDGGGSTALVVQGANGSPDVLNRPSGGAERYDGNNLGVYALPLAPVPLPPALVLFGSGLLGVFGFGRRRAAT